MSRAGDFDLISRGPSHRLGLRFGLGHPERPGRLRKVLVLMLVTYVPLIILSLAAGHAWGGTVQVPLFHDPVVSSRFLFVVPLLALADLVVSRSLGVQAQYFLDSGTVPERMWPRFESAMAEAMGRRDSTVAEGLMLILALGLALIARLFLRLSAGESTWERPGETMSLAGWWHALVSLPILLFFLFRWLWVFLIWSGFLYRVSRLGLELTPTHPDRVGGLGFLGWGQACFAPVVMAISAVLSGGFAYEIVHRGSSLNDLKYHVIVFVVLALVIVHFPLIVFADRLARCRFRGLLDFGILSGAHDRAFDEKWLKPQGTERKSLLGSPDVASVADVAIIYKHVEEMQLIPFDKKAVIVLLVAILIPMIPLLGTVIGLTEILSMLAKFLA
jgi:hypothetical protein